MARVEDMRPSHFPAWAGVSYWSAAYRLYARLGDVEGLYFVRSDCEGTLLAVAGSLMTNFRLHAARFEVTNGFEATRIAIDSRDAAATVTVTRDAPRLPAGSAFESIDEAAAFLKYQPFALSVDSHSRASIVPVRHDERLWHAHPRSVPESRWAFFEGHNVAPELAFELDPIPCHWDRPKVMEAPLPCARY